MTKTTEMIRPASAAMRPLASTPADWRCEDCGQYRGDDHPCGAFDARAAGCAR